MNWRRAALVAAWLITPSLLLAQGYRPGFLVPSNNLSDVTNTATARFNLGIPSVATASFPAQGYGSCVWDASSAHDVGPCILAARDAAIAFPGGGCVDLPAGQFSLKTLLPFTTAICLRGAGSSLIAATTGTELIWNGASGGRMMSVIAPFGSSSNRRLGNVQISGITLNGHAGLAADGLYLASLYGPRVDRVAFTGFNGGVALSLDVDAAIPGSTFSAADNPSIQKGSFTRIDIRQSGYTSTPLRLGNFINSGGSVGNASFNYFEGLSIIGNGAEPGILCYGCDNQTFVETNIAGTTVSVDMTIAVSGSQLYPANGNTFYHYLGSGSFIGRGQTTFPSCVGIAYPPLASCTWANVINDADRTNGSVTPTVEPGAQVIWSDNAGVANNRAFFGTAANPGIVVSNLTGDYNTCQQESLDNVASAATAYFCNGNNGDIGYFDNLAGSRFGFYFDGSGSTAKFALRRRAGTGTFKITVPGDSTSATTGAMVLTGGGLGAAGNGVFTGTVRSIGLDVGGTATDGPGMEMRWKTSGSTGSLLSYDRTLNAFAPMLLEASAITLAAPVTASALPTSAGAGGLYVCVDTAGVLYKKATCP